MLLRNNAVALALITIISSSNATQPGSVAASDARVKSSALVAHCLKTNPGLEDSAKSGGFMEGELDELMNRGKIIARLESRPQTRGTQIILRDARGEVQELIVLSNNIPS